MAWPTRAKNIANSPQTRFRIFSLTNQFTAMAILILKSQGKLDFKDLICKYLPNCPATWKAITIHQVLTHSSGIPDLPEDTQVRATPTYLEQFLTALKDKPLVNINPDSPFSYSNSGYAVLGYIIEKVSGKTYEEFLQQTIFTPVKMTNTGYARKTTPGLALGYKTFIHDDPVEFAEFLDFAAGVLYSSVEDMYLWDQALNTEKLVPKILLDEMFSPQVVIDKDLGMSYGYGWIVVKEKKRQLLEHFGGNLGYSTYIGRFPEINLSIIFFANMNCPLDTFLKILLKKLMGDD